jgi:AcrR family transcriptional regulator
MTTFGLYPQSMPRIAAETVADHRAMQRAAIVHAATDVLLEHGYAALNFSEVATRAGLARPSVYSYFKSKDDLVVAACEHQLPKFQQRIEQAMARAKTPRSRLTAFIRAQLEAAADGEHRLALAVEHADLSPEAWRRIGDLHERFAPGIVGVLAELGHSHPDVLAEFVQGIVNAGVKRIDAGEPPTRVIRMATELVIRGLAPHTAAARPSTVPPGPGSRGSTPN